MSKFKPSPGAGTAVAVPVRPAGLSPKSWFKTASRPPEAPKSAPAQTQPLANEIPLTPAVKAALENPLRKAAFKFTLAFLFLRFSFLHEFISAKLGVDSHLLILFGALAYFTAFMAGGIQRGFQEKSTWMWLGYAGCMAAATTTSVWKGGSFAVLLPYIRTALPLVLLIPAVGYTTEEIRKMINVIGIAGIVVMITGFLLGASDEGRLDLNSPGASIGNANDYAAHMVMVLPAIMFLLFAHQRKGIIKVLGIPIVGAALYQILHTGSRGGLVGIIVTVLVAALKGSGKVRAGLLIGIPVLGLITLPLLPRETVQRLESLFTSKDEPEEAAESHEQRQELFWASVNATLSHPLLGVGPGCFQIYQADVAGAQGERGMWRQTHNTYTQVSSESGIPAFLFFTSAVVMTFLYLGKGSKSEVQEIRPLASVLFIMAVGYAVCVIFLSQAYEFDLIAMTGLAISVKGVVDSKGAIDRFAGAV